MGKAITVSIVVFFAVFVLFAVWLIIKNDSSTEIQEILLKAGGAIALASYLLLNEFLIKQQDSISFQVPVPLVKNVQNNEVFTPFSIKSNFLPQEQNFFKGLQAFNSDKTYNDFKALAEDKSNFGPEKLDFLEFVFFSWLEREVGFLEDQSSLVFTHSGHGGGKSIRDCTFEGCTKIKLNQIENPNVFFTNHPVVVHFPSKSVFTRKTTNYGIEIDVRTSTGVFHFKFLQGSGGMFGAKLESSLVQNLASQFRLMYGVENYVSLEDQLFISYPLIIISYEANRSSKFSNQTKLELKWMKDVERTLYKDFSWDLLREYYSFGFEKALNSYRNHPHNQGKKDY